ncbi:glycosyltransferase [Marinomonas sp. 15G1-11]|uniref:Glycosyltransferase n=1 Tax=Marinomonas phaeophyticola TaxID=3004091 RepID=A0ABT4JZ30_9GAMM|nr:glycosyltransferase [Marinomonas sp. 15G1-11]MCZ2723347.1 glycosyltransferase [Marinomonas sp. 15G1-11]
MNILVIGYVWPEPNSSAAGSRMMQLLTSYRNQNWTVTFASPAQQTDHMANLEALKIQSVAIELNNSSFDEFIQQLSPDLVMFDRFMMEEQFGWRVEKHCPNALRLLNTEDLHSLRQARHQAIKQDKTFNILDMHNEHTVREVAAIFRSDLTLMISEKEVALLKTHFNVPAAQLYSLPFMLTIASEAESQQSPSFHARQHFISIGNFRHAPNWDAVLQLKTEIWPLIRKALPQAEMHIYGAYPPPKATQLHNPKQGFHIKGWAENAKEVMQQARVLLAPLRFGAGIKGKLVEAMETGTPSITTAIGAEAMHGSLPWNGVIVDDPTEFAEAAINLYQDENQWQCFQKNGERILREKYDKDLLEAPFIKHIIQHQKALSDIRSQNFMSMMLRHHSLKSTQYMSQWIEAKNKKEA